MTPEGLRSLFRHHRQTNGVTKANLDRFRHTFATDMIRAGISLPDARLPRPLTPEQDRLIQQELLRRNDLASNVLLVLRHTGMRIGECVDLSSDCLRPLGPQQWAIHVPLGKLKTERMVPVDSFVLSTRPSAALFPFTGPDRA